MEQPVLPEPHITLLQANLLAGAFAASYVGCLYLSQHTRLSYSSLNAPQSNGARIRRRDDPDVIRARLAAVAASTLSSCAVLGAVVWFLSPHGLSVAVGTTARLLGLSGPVVLLPCLIAPMLFLGPLYVMYLSRSLPFQRDWSLKHSVMPIFTTWQGFRNDIAAPITEEVVYRACVLSAYHMAGCSRTKMVFLSPLWFGLAHVHHGWEAYHRLGRTQAALQNAVLSVVVQLAYTTLFGFHCAFLFMRTGSLLAPVASHVFCNIMGLPGFASDLAIFPQKRTAIGLAYIGGVVGYVYTVGAWTSGYDSIYW